MQSNNGYIKVWRKLRQNPIYTNSKAVHVWLECLMRASFKEGSRYLKREKIKLEPGQFVMGREEFGDKLGMSGSTAWYWLKEFESNNMINIKSTTKGSIVTIENWEDYQNLDNKTDKEKTADKQQKNTNKNGKNVNNGNNGVNNKDSLSNPEEKYNKYAPINGRGLDYEEIKERWNSQVPEPLQITAMSKKRKKKLRTRFKEEYFSLEDITEAIQEQPFTHGKNDRGWIADFSWIIEDDENYIKVLERKYANNGSKQNKSKWEDREFV